MRKMTKTAVTLAAMSAMTLAASSLAFAATNQIDGITAINTDDSTTIAGPDTGKWDGSTKEGWTFTTDDGVKLKDTWANIDEVWYYFHKDGKMARDEILYLDGESYFFAENGAMATGWQQIKSDMDAYGDVDINDTLLEGYTHIAISEDEAYDYHDYVWCYFFDNGHAAENEWFQSPESGLWYYFDGHVMVRNVINYVIDPDNYDKDDSSANKVYGFDKNGAMLTGWNYLDGKSSWNGPTETKYGKTWFYYNSNGKMQTAGWKKIDDNWYLFSDADGDSYQEAGGSVEQNRKYDNAYPMIANSYIVSYPKENAAPEYFYLDDDGKMQTGITTLPGSYYYVTFYQADKKIKADIGENEMKDKAEIYFGSNGAAKEGIVNNRFYTLSDHTDGKTDVVMLDNNFTASDIRVSNTVLNMSTNVDIKAVSGSSINLLDDNQDGAKTAAVTDYDVKSLYGRVIKKAFIGNDKKNLYLADEDGDLVTYKAVIVQKGAFVIGQDDQNKDITIQDAYILFNRYGEAYKGYDVKNKSVIIGGKTYWSTGVEVEIANVKVSVFTINKQ